MKKGDRNALPALSSNKPDRDFHGEKQPKQNPVLYHEKNAGAVSGRRLCHYRRNRELCGGVWRSGCASDKRRQSGPHIPEGEPDETFGVDRGVCCGGGEYLCRCGQEYNPHFPPSPEVKIVTHLL
ncbi:hypothetical protein Desaci_1409 [Desulfosporosinus acidiphilus SJ4]|uniref:Uncharacterized protein n=1 Tax=Desulfosporosinus acidiphilus (strain DSM 22704 / JCM 16185 / SJ4) TaxID=646529 RepID=I4D3Q6_DESAJ|nr:hypothetical protein [Desulfosporosinus acidiphilus]AFM40430.1 hypothetical protein Desaci_1409 [Desulfosporosinus acidiphilus SJ4]